MIQKIFSRISSAFRTIPKRQDWVDVIALLTLFALIYLPIGFSLGFLQVEFQSSWQILLGVSVSAFFMPGLNEEFLFRALLIPHPTEAISLKKRWLFIGFSWVLFLLYHVHPWTPLFFRTPAFLIGAGLLGIVCTVSYLRSGSIWLPIFMHWLIVVIWLLGFGGLAKFQTHF
jgi:uncharacterized protein